MWAKSKRLGQIGQSTFTSRSKGLQYHCYHLYHLEMPRHAYACSNRKLKNYWRRNPSDEGGRARLDGDNFSAAKSWQQSIFEK